MPGALAVDQRTLEVLFHLGSRGGRSAAQPMVEQACLLEGDIIEGCLGRLRRPTTPGDCNVHLYCSSEHKIYTGVGRVALMRPKCSRKHCY